MDLNNTTKTVLVTGGSRGIGAAISLELGRKEYNVIVNYNTKVDEANAIVDQIIKQGGNAIAIQANIAIPEDSQRLFQEIESKYGQVDILVNNAGITRDKSFRKMQKTEWDEVINTNLSSAYNQYQFRNWTIRWIWTNKLCSS